MPEAATKAPSLSHPDSARGEPAISPRLLRLLGLTIVVIIAHGIEEYLMGFHDVNPTVTIPAGYVATIAEGIFGTFQLMLWLLLVVLYVALKGERRSVLRVLTVIAVVLSTEIHHIIAAVIRRGYYPGLVTALIFPVLAVFFWRELLREWRSLSSSGPSASEGDSR